MRVEFRVWVLTDAGEKFFGEGPYRLLRGVERLGSLRAAAGELGMAYSKANRILGRAEQFLGAPLTRRRIGGPDGGGSALTPLARELLARYDALRADCEAAAKASFARNFGDLPDLAKGDGGCPSREEGRHSSCESRNDAEGKRQSSDESAPTGSMWEAGMGALSNRMGEAPAMLGCVVLAAGRARRFGGGKLLAELAGRPVLARTLDALPRDCFCRIVVVTSDPAVTALCRERGFSVREYPGGALSDSIREGLAEMDGTDGCAFVNGDQPLLRPTSLRRLAVAFASDPAHVYRLSHGGIAASPAIFPASAYPALRSLIGERGGMAALKSGEWEVRTVEAEEESELWDVDDPAALRRAEARVWENLRR